ncbi:hypothetical protein MPTK1_1g20150 [Marchantia polymorpha subsp. ruderalis]|uniref:Uncharacterized protein n=2 Tax=Marchantia polymorpha TaxID=3197 RepID=A0AAF6AS61_MARPO|nr:hypothetical protein MARPO_0001s0352 [Marchantia polymorpha]BBM99281.1 hypothetical protein Mp_1g20150 [Marchantia polymorpha subsp. ruderalis]|eukprot:PTQ50363.1 hypothetical protein MARPO_0001s0352 [Marchantia polymorpha]
MGAAGARPPGCENAFVRHCERDEKPSGPSKYSKKSPALLWESHFPPEREPGSEPPGSRSGGSDHFFGAALATPPTWREGIRRTWLRGRLTRIQRPRLAVVQ